MMSETDLQIIITDIEREQEEARKAKEALQQAAIQLETQR